MAKQKQGPRKEGASISGGKTPEEIGEFWDTHDFTDFQGSSPDVTGEFQFEIESVRHLVSLEPQLLQKAITSAHRQGIAVQTLVNLAVKEAIERSPGP